MKTVALFFSCGILLLILLAGCTESKPESAKDYCAKFSQNECKGQVYNTADTGYGSVYVGKCIWFEETSTCDPVVCMENEA